MIIGYAKVVQNIYRFGEIDPSRKAAQQQYVIKLFLLVQHIF